ncbi:MAG: ATPase, YjeE family [Microgenomates group bacterium GW2011_GWA2_44_7]|nr:MAG: ATPase, YjeE family [Microgenomates group bacterium GW2011_GWA2_44_7]KKT78434.1 MAG: ATPase, YjeE family [Microgenomates group bacterium GW2011_GWB1_44_8]
MKEEVLSASAAETYQLGRKTAKRLLSLKHKQGAVTVGLTGQLGSGKTVFVQGFARGLEIKDQIVSPTFILMRNYTISKSDQFKYLYHVDLYRIKANDINSLGIKNLLTDKSAILIIEWADKIRDNLPPDTIWISFSHRSIQSKRHRPKADEFLRRIKLDNLNE